MNRIPWWYSEPHRQNAIDEAEDAAFMEDSGPKWWRLKLQGCKAYIESIYDFGPFVTYEPDHALLFESQSVAEQAACDLGIQDLEVETVYG